MVSNDYKAHIFNESLILIKSVVLHNRAIHYIDFIDETSTIVACSVDGILLFDFEYNGVTDLK